MDERKMGELVSQFAPWERKALVVILRLWVVWKRMRQRGAPGWLELAGKALLLSALLFELMQTSHIEAFLAAIGGGLAMAVVWTAGEIMLTNPRKKEVRASQD